jgi:hypothetical protein
LCDALRWLARRFISFALWAPRITSSIDHWCITAERNAFLRAFCRLALTN